MNNLDYDYTGNQLSTVTELTGGNTTPYEYDDNGNMTNDHYKGISVAYNELNLPEHVDYGDDDAYYYHTATGGKLRMVVEEGTTTKQIDYVGSELTTFFRTNLNSPQATFFN